VAELRTDALRTFQKTSGSLNHRWERDPSHNVLVGVPAKPKANYEATVRQVVQTLGHARHERRLAKGNRRYERSEPNSSCFGRCHRQGGPRLETMTAGPRGLQMVGYPN
jgi:hypothetical protein